MSSPKYNCDQCGINLLETNNYFVVKAKIWREGDGKGLICIKCFEKGLGRKIKREDLILAPINLAMLIRSKSKYRETFYDVMKIEECVMGAFDDKRYRVVYDNSNDKDIDSYIMVEGKWIKIEGGERMMHPIEYPILLIHINKIASMLTNADEKELFKSFSNFVEMFGDPDAKKLTEMEKIEEKEKHYDKLIQLVKDRISRMSDDIHMKMAKDAIETMNAWFGLFKYDKELGE